MLGCCRQFRAFFATLPLGALVSSAGQKTKSPGAPLMSSWVFRSSVCPSAVTGTWEGQGAGEKLVLAPSRTTEK